MPPADRRPLEIEVVDEEIVAVLRTMTPAERFEVANKLWIFAREMLTSQLSSTHPEWSPEDVAREVARRMAASEDIEIPQDVVRALYGLPPRAGR